MATTSDEIIRVTGGPTVNEGLRTYFIAGSTGTAANSLQELERIWLQAKVPGEAGTNQDKWVAYLRDIEGFSDSFNEMYNQFWATQLPI